MASGGEDGDDSKRNLVVDEAAFEEQFLRCHICREKYDQTEKRPKSLPCNHTFCLPCLKQVFDHSQTNTRRAYTWADESYEGVLQCPECRVEIFLSRTEISALPNDHRVIQMMDFLSQVQVKSQNVCTKHERQPLNFFCKSCLVPVCRDCTVLDHKEQSDHTIVDVSQALNDNSDEFNEAENKSKKTLSELKSRSDALANASKRLDLLERQLRGTIKDTFIEYRLLLERRQQAQIDILHEAVKEQKAKINSRFVEVCTQGSQLQKLHDTFTKARPANDITQLFTVHKEMKEKEGNFAQVANANDDELFVGCRFEVDNEPLFLSELSCLGEITKEADMELKKPVPAHQLVVLDMEERRKQEAAHQIAMESQELMATHSEQTTHGDAHMTTTTQELDRIAARAEERAARLRQMEGADEMEEDVDDTSTYLLRIASRLNASSNNLSEAILDLSRRTDDSEADPREEAHTGSGGRNSSSSSSSSRSRRPRDPNVRVVRHPQMQDGGHGYSSTRYSGGGSGREKR